jgi:uncharacterized membrane protein
MQVWEGYMGAFAMLFFLVLVVFFLILSVIFLKQLIRASSESRIQQISKSREVHDKNCNGDPC